MDKIEKQVSLQEDMLDKVKKAYTNYKKSPLDRITVGYVKGRLDTLEGYWKDFKSVHEKLIMSMAKEERQGWKYFTDETFTELEEIYYSYKGDMKTKLDELLLEKCEAKEVSNPYISKSDVKLPSITLPSFNGNYTEWQSFHDLFMALVHNNGSLEAVQKLHYLKGSLSGEAELLLRQYSITGENYDEAWSILKKRYSNKRYIANSIFKKFFAQKAILHESATALRQLLDTSVECISALKNIGLPTVQWDAIINFVVVSKLDSVTRKQWEEFISNDTTDNIPDFERLKSFLETRFRTLEMIEPVNKTHTTKVVHPKTFHVTATSEPRCALCNENHYLFKCKHFSKKPIGERYEFVQTNNLCFNCLVPNHNAFKCRQRTACQICKRKHHSLLHRDKQQAGEKLHTSEGEPHHKEDTKQPNITAHTANVSHLSKNVLLATALVYVTSRSGQSHVFRALIDQGSEASFVTARAVELLGLKKTEINGVVSGVGEGNQMSIKHMVGLHLKSRYDLNFSINVNAYIFKSLTRKLPATEIKSFSWPQLSNVKLADPTFYIPGRIDLLLGADVFGQIIDSGLMRGPGNLVAQSTHLGWILSGDVNMSSFNISQHITSLHIISQVEEDNNLLKKFWEVESELYTKQRMWSKEEERCEEIYQKTTTRDADGRYVVQLPLKKTIEETVKSCGDTKQQAVLRLKQLERKFERNENLKIEYKKVIQEYIQLGHMKKAEMEDTNPAVYLAHRAVIREDKDTTKLRVVFDASAKGSNGSSLNSSMMVGPTIQPDLRSLIIRWRSHKFCVVGDIVKMYRQVKIVDKHIDLQRILWRDDLSEDIQSYQLLTVTFGTAAAPYLAVRTLHRLADDEENLYPRGAAVVRNSFYMDDLMTGHEDLSELQSICKEINTLLKTGGFQMQKWSSNSEELLGKLQHDVKTPEPVKDIKEIKLDEVIKILGLTWNRKDDTFHISVKLPENRRPATKRTILSEVASLFDPFGWLSPVIVTAKIMIQKLWLCNLGWDDELPAEVIEEWESYRDELQELQRVEITRWIKTTSRCKDIQLHGFSDASSLAIAAVVYARVVDEFEEVHISMLAAKTRVAPLKQLTIPRLELCAATLLAKLLHDLSDILKISMNKVYAWTDSMVVLSWLQSPPSRWQVFVGNRVSDITQQIDNDRWRHVMSGDNPADLASRGVKAGELSNNRLWWAGPAWLKVKEAEFTRTQIIPHTDLETKKSFHVNHNVLQATSIWERFSSLNKMRRVLAYCKRFIDYKNKHKREESLSVTELNDVEEKCIKYYQDLVYKTEIDDLKKMGKVKKRSPIVSLTPYLDEYDLLRVGGRLTKSQLPEDSKHPIIIPSKQHITKLIVTEAHTKTFHGTILQTMTYIRSKYWIVGLRSAVKDVARKCAVCMKHEATTKRQLMGQLPASRVIQRRAFYNSGVDYAGPIYMRTSKGRGHTSTKGYICLFVCMCTRATHLEAVTDLTAQAFIAAFRRFVARRGHCAHIWSDNGTCFVGADKELRNLFKNSTNKVRKEIADQLANDGTTWHFIPARAPNFGGLWEAAIRSAKRHLIRVNGNTKLTYEEMATLLAQVEACLNSRPLCQLDETVDTLNPLTPGHFLIGEPLIGIPDSRYNQISVNQLSRWQLIQRQTDDFWRRWQSEYLHTLQQRHKWQEVVPSPCVGDVVIIKDEELPPAKWLLGKIKTLHPGTDNLVRVVSVQCKGDNILKRPLSKLILLPKHPDE